jgi:hypothetical protein
MHPAAFENLKAGASPADMFSMLKGAVTIFSANLSRFAEPLCLLFIQPEYMEVSVQQAQACAYVSDDVIRLQAVIYHRRLLK